MRAISLWQPWASAMAMGLKAIETRHWQTGVRGMVAIHAAKRWTSEEAGFAFAMGLPDKLPLGAVVAVGMLHSCLRVEAVRGGLIGTPENEWGNYSDGRFAWIFRDLIGLDEPVSCRGAQGFFELPDAVAAKALNQCSQHKSAAEAGDLLSPLQSATLGRIP